MSNLIARNITSSSIVVSGYRVFSIDSTDVEVVIVENTSSHDRRNAFKYTENGTSYWYVVGINHIGWVSDLSTIGYEEVPAVDLPTVSVSDWWIQFQYGQTMLFEPGTTTGCYKSTGDRMLYEADKSYAIIQIRNQNNQLYGSNTYLQIYSDTGDMSVRNVSDKTFRSIQCLHAICDTVVDVITVLDASNNPFNAFKYTVGGIDYYYVLEPDGWGIKQTYWTDDLSSLGYHEPFPTVSVGYGYVEADKTPITTTGAYIELRDDNGNFIVGDSNINYIVSRYYNAQSDIVGQIPVSSSVMWVYTNAYSHLQLGINSSSDLTVQRVQFATCSDSTATVVTVYNSSNVVYNAFKFTASGMDYYFVLDGTQTDWTNDLESIGYSLTPVVVLPTVSKTGDGTISITTIPNGNGFSTPFSYDSTKIYSVSTGNGSGGTTKYGWVCSNVSDYIYATNNTGGNVTVFGYSVYECNSLSASVVTVYNASNIGFSAFKFTANGTDYYYVLDGTQSDWTDDLAGIGYRDYIETTYYYYDKSYTTVSNNSWVYLYDNGTTTIPVDDVSKYEFVKYYTGSTDTTGRDYGITLSVSNGKLTAKNTSGATIVLQRVDVRIHS